MFYKQYCEIHVKAARGLTHSIIINHFSSICNQRKQYLHVLFQNQYQNLSVHKVFFVYKVIGIIFTCLRRVCYQIKFMT